MPKMDKPGENEKAKKYALLLLKFSPRTKLEIIRRLEEKNFSPSAIEQTVSFLESGEYINDAKFIKLYLGQKLDKPIPFERIKEAIILKGIEESILEEQLKKNPPLSEDERLVSLGQEKLDKTPSLSKEKLKDYFLRQGFDEIQVDEAMERL